MKPLGNITQPIFYINTPKKIVTLNTYHSSRYITFIVPEITVNSLRTYLSTHPLVDVGKSVRLKQ